MRSSFECASEAETQPGLANQNAEPGVERHPVIVTDCGLLIPVSKWGVLWESERIPVHWEFFETRGKYIPGGPVLARAATGSVDMPSYSTYPTMP